MVWSDHQDTTATTVQTRIGVQQVGRPVQRHHRLAGAGTPVDDQGATRGGTDDGVLVGLQGGQHVTHPG